MTTPPGTRSVTFSLENGDKVLVYSDSTRIFLQLRHNTPTEQDILTSSHHPSKWPFLSQKAMLWH